MSMSKNRPLTEQDMQTFKPSRTTAERLAAFQAQSGKERSAFRVLDWGCGRGRFVSWLLDRGFDAYGVEIDPSQVEFGRDYFAARGRSVDQRLHLVNAAGRTSFESGFFDCVVSQQVLEHVSDLPAVAAEMHRLTGPGGTGFHICPARLRPVEPHLRMPAVHWIPKGDSRRAAIRLFTRLGVEPRWPQHRHLPVTQRADAYYEYSVGRTFYRPARQIAHTFGDAGLSARVVSALRSMPSRRLGWLAFALRNAAANSLLSTFYFVDIETVKRPAAVDR